MLHAAMGEHGGCVQVWGGGRP